MKFFTCIFLIIYSFNCYTQESKKIYFDKEWNAVSRNDNYTYYRKIKIDNLGNPIGEIINYYSGTGAVQWVGKFKSKNLECATSEECKYYGLCTWYYPKGGKSREALYENGVIVGQEKYWDETGQEIDPELKALEHLSTENGFKTGVEYMIKENGFLSLEGIYDAKINYQVYSKKKLVLEKTNFQKLGIIRFGKNFKVFEIDNGPNGIKILNSNIKDNYKAIYTQKGKRGFDFISRGSVKQIDHQNVKMVIELNPDLIKDNMGPDYIPDLNVFMEYNLSKYFPSNLDLDRIRKDILEEAPRSGTGFAISSNGIIVTNYHVINNSSDIKVRGINGNFNQSLKAELILEDKINDLAIIKINDSRFEPIETIPFKIKPLKAEVGEDIFVLGYPLTATMGEEIKLTTGIISAQTGFQGSASQYQISAPIQSGNSGGPLFDKSGNLIGIINSKHLNTENVGYAIKSDHLKDVIDKLPEVISLPNNAKVVGKSLSEQVKYLRDFVFIIEVNK